MAKPYGLPSTVYRLLPSTEVTMSTQFKREVQLVETPLLPPGYCVPNSRYIHPSTRMRELLRTEPYLFGPGVYDPLGAQQVMYYGFKAVYFRGYSFEIGFL